MKVRIKRMKPVCRGCGGIHPQEMRICRQDEPAGLLDFLARNFAHNFGVSIGTSLLLKTSPMKKLLNLILAIALFGPQMAIAQQAGEGKAPARIIGTAKDLKTGEPVGYATAAL